MASSNRKNSWRVSFNKTALLGFVLINSLFFLSLKLFFPVFDNGLALTEDQIKRIPIIDIGRSRSRGKQRKLIASRVFDAAQEFGYFLVTNHGIPEKALKRLWRVHEQYFALPNEIKLHRPFNPSKWIGWRYGFGGPGHGRGEQFMSRNSVFMDEESWPSESESPGLKDIMLSMMDLSEKLALDVTHLLAIGMGLPEKYYDKNLTGVTDNLNSAGMFYHDRVAAGIKQPHYPHKGHKDGNTFITLLIQRDPGLEMCACHGIPCDKASEIPGSYTPVPMIPGTVMVVLGRFSDWATDDMAKSSCHRVNADLFPSSSPRRSFAYWLRANEHATLQGPQHKYAGVFPGYETGQESIDKHAKWWFEEVEARRRANSF